jgi:hypothetical protein
MVSTPDDGVSDRGGPGEHDYQEKAEALRVIAARLQTVSEELLALAQQYDQLGKFTKDRVAAWLLRFKQLTPQDKESPAASAARRGTVTTPLDRG